MQRRYHVRLALVAMCWAFNLGSICIADTHNPTLEFRMNYDMFFRPLKHASIKTDVWRQVFVVEITGCAVAQHCYDGDVSFLWEKWKLWPPVKSKPLNRLTHNLSGLITSTRWTFVLNLVKSVHGGLLGKGVKYNFLCDFFIYLFLLGPT